MNYNEKFNNFINESFNLVGATSLIYTKDGLLNEAYYGYQDKENAIKTNKDTIYKVASISKVITAIGIMKLVEDGILDIKEDVSKYLGFNFRNPYFKDDVITLEMIMTQTSSLCDCGDGEKGYYGTMSGFIDIPLIDILYDNGNKYYCSGVWSKNKPGTVWDYCNLGCGILACIIEKVTNKIFDDYIKEVLLLPLGIKSGFRVDDIFDIDSLAVHYQYDEEKDLFYIYRNVELFIKNQSNLFSYGNNYTGIAGGLYINPQNLGKIMMMLMNNGVYKDVRILKEETVLNMKKIHWSGESWDNAYTKKGLQMVILDKYEEPLMGHFGNAYGLRAFMLFNDEYGYIFTSNGGNYLGEEEHLTILLDKVIKFMIENKEV